MTGFIHDIHDIPASGTVGQTMRKHLLNVHDLIVPDTDTLDDLSKRHAEKHDRLGNDHPHTNSETTNRQIRDIQVAHITELDVILPEWVYTHSYLSDLRSIDRLIRAAYLARPSTVQNPDPEGVDNPTQA